jgi:hypothetical protein
MPPVPVWSRAAAVALTITSVAHAVELRVDFGVGDVEEFLSASPNDVQAGFSDFSVDATQDGIGGVLDLANASGVQSRVFSGVTVSVELGSGPEGDGAFFDGPDEFDPLGDLTEDGVSGIDVSDVILRLTDLPAGPYAMTTYHYASDLIVLTVSTISIDLFLDAGAGESLVAADVSPGANELATVAIPFTADGTQDVSLRIGGVSPWINGFTVIPVPEPAGSLLMVVGIGGLLAARWWQRRSG